MEGLHGKAPVELSNESQRESDNDSALAEVDSGIRPEVLPAAATETGESEQATRATQEGESSLTQEVAIQPPEVNENPIIGEARGRFS